MSGGSKGCYVYVSLEVGLGYHSVDNTRLKVSTCMCWVEYLARKRTGPDWILHSGFGRCSMKPQDVWTGGRWHAKKGSKSRERKVR